MPPAQAMIYTIAGYSEYNTQPKNDTVSETFPLKHVDSEGICFPTRYIKIVPISVHAAVSFHIAIWYAGITDPLYVDNIRSRYEQYRETKAEHGEHARRSDILRDGDEENP
ncbi:uncharacterized protein F5891DRAFT_1277348 [Suillus fuscotomentosus]|uniref:Muskelin N-terminal domain-containing protein n=1 Tax=Suillus fuscotomentosus TaxID=1912939 RepID=A0AAD4HLB0_9AGAM|nr:uncharacterized protein F5891DRAFT_1277348 [Suillus fuscotomentosus]KAG1901875.1 hypothetical protein F5891DRAFT_1277348 [Suillus fuscotomentosus]